MFLYRKENGWCLARYNDKLIKLKPTLREMGIYFEYKNRKSYKTRLYNAIFKFYTMDQRIIYYLLQNAKIYLNTLEKNLQETEERMYDLKEFGYQSYSKMV